MLKIDHDRMMEMVSSLQTMMSGRRNAENYLWCQKYIWCV